MTGADALTASGAVREMIEALVAGARQREVANMAIQAMPNPSMFAAAKQTAAETLARLQAAMAEAAGLVVPQPLADLRAAADSLAEPVEELWREETIVLDGLAGGDRQAAVAAQQRSQRLFQATDDGMAALVAAAHRLADGDPAAFAALGLSRAAVIGLAFPDPGDPDDQEDETFDAETWLAALRAELLSDADDRAAALRAEAETWHVRAGELRARRDDLPEGMSRQRWLREIDEAEARVTAILRSIEEDEGFVHLHEVPLRLPGTGQTFVLAADGSGDFTGFGEAMEAMPSGATLLVRPGRYEPGSLIVKTLDIVGDGPVEEIVIASEFHSVIPVQALGGSLRGVTVRNEGGPDRYALWVTDGQIAVSDCVLESDGEAVVHVTGERAVPRLDGCTVRGGSHGVLVRFGGVSLAGTTVTGSRDAGVSVQGVGFASVMQCEIAGNGGIGLDLGRGGQAIVGESRIERNGGPGVRAAAGAWLRISRSRIDGNGGPDVLMPGADVENDGEPLPEAGIPLGAVVSATLAEEAHIAEFAAGLMQALEGETDAAMLQGASALLTGHADWAAALRDRFGGIECPENLLHILRETEECLAKTEESARELAAALASTEAGDRDAATGLLSSATLGRAATLRRVEALGFMLAFLRHRDPDAFDALGLSVDASSAPWLLGWDTVLSRGGGEGSDPHRIMACSVNLVPLPAALMDRRGEEMEPLLVGDAGEAERLWWTLSGMSWSEEASALRDEFHRILAASLRKLVQRGEEPISPLEHVAMVAARRPLDLTATVADTITCSGGHCYPGLGVELGEPRPDNQWYLLKIPEAWLVFSIVKAAMGFRNVHVSTSTAGVPHAGFLPMYWRSRAGTDIDLDVILMPDPGHRAFDGARERIAAIAEERDARLAEWTIRARALLDAQPAA